MVTATKPVGFTWNEMREFLDFMYPNGAPDNFLSDYFELRNGLWYIKDPKDNYTQKMRKYFLRFLGKD